MLKEFTKYTVVGGIATAVDWSVFYAATHPLGLNFQIGLTLAYTCGTVTHFFLNRLVTFKAKKINYKRQIPLYLMAVGTSYLLNSVLMQVWVSWIGLPLMKARILTTGLMLLVNYLLHRQLSFNPEWVKTKS